MSSTKKSAGQFKASYHVSLKFFLTQYFLYQFGSPSCPPNLIPPFPFVKIGLIQVITNIGPEVLLKKIGPFLLNRSWGDTRADEEIR
jgi:hypothetical protein